MGSLAGVIAHGGVAGAIGEAFVGVAVAAVFVAVWIRERRARREQGPARTAALNEPDEE